MSAFLKRLLVIASECVIALPAFAQLDATLLRQAESWKPGEAPPPRLLKFPDGKIDKGEICGLSVVGSEVSEYISRITNPDLLGALLLDSRAQTDSIRAAASQLIALKGTEYVARLLAKHDRASLRSELAVLAELLRSPYVAIQVARISNGDMAAPDAEEALKEMRATINAGATWASAYGKVADKHPDLKDRAKSPTSVRTLVCYLYDGVVSPSGFDILTYAVASDLPSEHLKEVFRVGHGTHVLKTAGAVYLYHIKPQ